MSIAIIGAGKVGLALGGALTRQGEPVEFGVQDVAKYQTAVAALGEKARISPMQNAIAAHDLVILAVPYAATASIADSVLDWQGKIVVDATNPIAPGFAGLALGTHTSGAEALAKRAHGARVVKAFNTTGAENLADSRYDQGQPIMPICGDDPQARERVMALATLIGFEALDMGTLEAARFIEPFAFVWIHLAIKQGYGRHFAFSRVQRSR